MRRMLLLALLAMLAMALHAPAALAQDDDDDDDDDDAAALPKTGGPSLLALFAGLFLVGSGVLSFSVLRRE